MRTSRLPDALVADANVLLSATIGGRASLILESPVAPKTFAPASVGDEILEHLPGIAKKRGLDLGVLLPAVAALPVEWVEVEACVQHEEEARRRIGARDLDDWPVVAAALHLKSRKLDFAIWTQDKDFSVSGMSTVTTGQILDQLEGRAE